jgi:hypothetical protein
LALRNSVDDIHWQETTEGLSTVGLLPVADEATSSGDEVRSELSDVDYAAAWQARRSMRMPVCYARTGSGGGAMWSRPCQIPNSEPDEGRTSDHRGHTVGRHIDNIYGTIGVHERSKARLHAWEHGLHVFHATTDTIESHC